MAVSGRHILVSQQNHSRHRTDVQESQEHKLTHELLQRNPHLAIGLEASSQEDQGQDDAKDDEDGSPNAVEEVMAVVFMADLGDDGDDDIDEGKAADWVKVSLPRGMKI